MKRRNRAADAAAPVRNAAWTALVALLGAACAPAVSSADHARAAAPHGDDETLVAEFGRLEDDAMGWLAAADPRLATRESATAPEDVLKRIGTDAVLAEDVTAGIRGSSLDLFAFRARGRALDQAAQRIGAFTARLPDSANAPAGIARPRLEHELLARLIEEERARVLYEARLGDASGDLVRAIVATWTPPAIPRIGPTATPG